MSARARITSEQTNDAAAAAFASADQLRIVQVELQRVSAAESSAKASIAELKHDLGSAHAEIKQLREQCATLTESSSTWKHMVERLQADLEAAKNSQMTHERAVEQRVELEATVARLTSEVSHSQAAQSELKELRAKLSAALVDAAQTRSNFEQTRTQLEGMTTKYNAATAKLSHFESSEHGEGRAASLAEECEALRDQLQHAEQDKARQQTRMTELSSEVEFLKQERQAQVSKLEMGRESLLAELSGKEAEIGKLEGMLSSYKSHFEHWQRDRMALDELQASSNRLQSSLDDVTAANALVETARQKAVDEAELAAKQAAKVTERKRQLEAELTTCKSQCDGLQSGLAELQRKHNHVGQQHASLQEEYTALKTEHSAQQQSLQELRQVEKRCGKLQAAQTVAEAKVRVVWASWCNRHFTDSIR